MQNCILATAFLHDDGRCKSAYTEAMSDKEEIRREQRDLLDQITKTYKLTLTEVADRCGMASTTLTRFYNSKDAKHVLGSPTLNKVKKHFPLKLQPQGMTDAERALTSALMVLIQVALHPKPVPKRSFIAAFSALEADYQESPIAVEILQKLSAFVSNEPAAPREKALIEKLLQLPALGPV